MQEDLPRRKVSPPLSALVIRRLGLEISTCFKSTFSRRSAVIMFTCLLEDHITTKRRLHGDKHNVNAKSSSFTLFGYCVVF